MLHSDIDIENLTSISKQIRLDVMKMVYEAKDGHPGPSFSIADIITALYFHEMNIDPQQPGWEDRDRFILSKGHACPALYTALAYKGYFSKDEFSGLRRMGRMLQGHPDMNKTPGIDITSGSLGNGLAMGVGMALAAKYRKKSYMTYVAMGDGELQEGLVWEAAMCASRYKLNNLIAFIDYNGWQSGGSLSEVSGVLPLLPKWEAFNWNCQVIDGHDFLQIHKAIVKAKECLDQPSMIIAKTIKGKGLPFMEDDNSWHKRVPTDAEMAQAVALLGGC